MVYCYETGSPPSGELFSRVTNFESTYLGWLKTDVQYSWPTVSAA